MSIERVTDDVRPNPEWERYQVTVSAMTKAMPPVGSAKITGRQLEADHFVKTRQFRALPGVEYELEGWMKIARTSDEDLDMRFAVVLSDDAGNVVSTAASGPYDMSKIGQWQGLECTFTTPSQTTRAVIAVPKPQQKDVDAEFYIDDIFLNVIGFD